MHYREIKPNGFLKNFVQCFWTYQCDGKDVRHTILPDGYFDLIAEFENEVLTTVKLTGVWTEPKDIHIPGNTTFIAIRFKLPAAEYLFRQEIKAILNTTQNLPFNFWNINDYAYNEFDRFVTDSTNHMENSIKQLNRIDDRKLNLFDLIYKSGIKTVAGLAEKAHWSSRQMNRYFNAQFGFPLKEYLKIVRCNASYSHISDGELAPQEDYFDQAHFIKDLKKYTGTTPGELHKNKNDRFLQLSKVNRK